MLALELDVLETALIQVMSLQNFIIVHLPYLYIDYQDYVDSLGEASCYLKKTLDWDHPADLDLERISDAMGRDWEVSFSTTLGFTQRQVDDLKHTHRFDHPALLRYVCYCKYYQLEGPVENPQLVAFGIQNTTN